MPRIFYSAQDQTWYSTLSSLYFRLLWDQNEKLLNLHPKDTTITGRKLQTFCKISCSLPWKKNDLKRYESLFNIKKRLTTKDVKEYWSTRNLQRQPLEYEKSKMKTFAIINWYRFRWFLVFQNLKRETFLHEG